MFESTRKKDFQRNHCHKDDWTDQVNKLTGEKWPSEKAQWKDKCEWWRIFLKIEKEKEKKKKIWLKKV